MSPHALGSFSRSCSRSPYTSLFRPALGNFNLHFLLRRSFAHSTNVTSCPWQFLSLRRSITHSLNVLSCPRQLQFTFPAPAVIRTFTQFHSMHFTISLAPACYQTFPECLLMPLAVSLAPAVDLPIRRSSVLPSATSIYISRSGGHSHIP